MESFGRKNGHNHRSSHCLAGDGGIELTHSRSNRSPAQKNKNLEYPRYPPRSKCSSTAPQIISGTTTDFCCSRRGVSHGVMQPELQCLRPISSSTFAFM